MFVRLVATLAALACTVGLAAGQSVVSKGGSAEGPSDGKSTSETLLLAEGFGIGVAIQDSTAFVGESQGTLVEGLVIVYVRPSNTDTWTVTDTLFASPAIPGGRFGETVAVDGNWLFVGAPADNDQEGAVYVFEQQSFGVWTQHQVLAASTPVAAAGYASGGLAVSGDYAIVGAASQESAFVYRRENGTNMWSQEAKLVGNSPGSVRRFGWSVDIDSSRAVVGAIREFSFKGGAYVFERDGGGSWNQTGLVSLSDGITFDYFGGDVELKGDYLLVATLGLGARSALVTAFVRNGGGTWVEKNRVSGIGSNLHADSGVVAAGLSSVDSLFVVDFDSTFSVEDGFKSAAASSGEQVGYRVGLSGDYLVAGAPGDFTGTGRVYFFDRQPDSTWMEVGSFEGTGETFASITGGTIPCESGFASVFPCQGLNLVTFIAASDLLGSGHLSDVWGWYDQASGREYAIVTQETGTNFIDVSDPENPLLMGFLPNHGGSVPNVWHDARTFADHAFIVADGAGAAGMQVYDLAQLSGLIGSPVGSASPPNVLIETAHYNGIASAHNVSINEATGYAYVVGSNGGGTTCGGGLHMVDVSVPASPSFAGCFADPTTGRSGTGYTHDVQCVIYHGPDVVHQGKEVCFSSNETHMVIADVSDKGSPSTIGKGTYPEARYVHQGWLTEDQRYFLQDDELDETGGTESTTTTYIWNVEDLDDPVLAATFFNPTGVIDHNQFVLGRYSVQANYTSGLRIIDFGDPLNPSEVAYFDTYPAGNPLVFDAAWGNYPYLPSGIILATSIKEGFFVLKPAIPLGLALDLHVFLEGPYAGSDTMSTGAMFTAALPTQQPYSGAAFDGSQVEYDMPVQVNSMPQNAVDWVLVELRETAGDTQAVTAETGLLLRDGRVVGPTGDTLRFDGALPGSYWVVVRHRNHASVMSSSPVDLSNGSGSWDFTDGIAKAYGTNGMKSLGDGRFAMFASDGSIDGFVTAPDFNLWNSATTAGLSGYQQADYDLDGFVTAPDFNLWNANTGAGAASAVPD